MRRDPDPRYRLTACNMAGGVIAFGLVALFQVLERFELIPVRLPRRVKP